MRQNKKEKCDEIYGKKFQEKVSKLTKVFGILSNLSWQNKGTITRNDITLVEGKNVITDVYEISQTFNNKHYIKIVEKTCGKKPNEIATKLGSLNVSDVNDRISKSYQTSKCVKD